MGALKEGSLLKVKENFEVLVFLEKFCPYLFTETHTMLMIFFPKTDFTEANPGKKEVSYETWKYCKHISYHLKACFLGNLDFCTD